MTDPQTNRRSRRIQVHGEVEGDGIQPFKALLVNLSSDGVCVEHSTKLEPGQECDLRFRIPPMSFSVRVRVVWCNRHRRDSGAPDLFRSGAEFVHISGDARAAIDAIVPRPPA